MEKQDLRIIYMGTPDFAVESLKRLVEGDLISILRVNLIVKLWHFARVL